MKTIFAVVFPTLAGILIGLALAQAPLAQQNPLKPTSYATSIVAAEPENDRTAAWLLLNDGSVRLCAARLDGDTPRPPVCTEAVTP